MEASCHHHPLNRMLHGLQNQSWMLWNREKSLVLASNQMISQLTSQQPSPYANYAILSPHICIVLYYIHAMTCSTFLHYKDLRTVNKFNSVLTLETLLVTACI